MVVEVALVVAGVVLLPRLLLLVEASPFSVAPPGGGGPIVAPAAVPGVEAIPFNDCPE